MMKFSASELRKILQPGTSKIFNASTTFENIAFIYENQFWIKI
jgi:hypothetical protein